MTSDAGMTSQQATIGNDPVNDRPQRRNFVLVHGGGHGGWCYGLVADALISAGHRVFAPTLTGLGERVHLLSATISLNTHVLDVANVLRFEDLDDVILVGHSYGGGVITGVADEVPDRIGQLVFLDASMPGNGQSIADASPGIHQFADADKRVVDGIELILWPDNPIARMVYGLTDDTHWQWAERRLTPHPWRTFLDPLSLRDEGRVRSIPTTVINCTSTLAARSAEDFSRHRDAVNLWEMNTGHDMMITEPAATAELLLRLV